MEQKQENASLSYFARASRLNAQIFATDKERLNLEAESGVERLKRATLGLCGIQTVKLNDDLANLLVQIGMATSHDEGLQIIPEITGNTYHYGNMNYLRVEEVKDKAGRKGCRFSAYSCSGLMS